MMMKERERYAGSESRRKENFMIQMTSPMLYDRLHILSAEYSVPEEMLVNIAVKRLLEDVDLVRNLRVGKIKP